MSKRSVKGTRAWLGIDPGVKGSAVVVNNKGGIIDYDCTADLVLPEKDIINVLENYDMEYQIEYLSLEKVWAGQNKGSKGNFVLGENFGVWKSAIHRIFSQYTFRERYLVTPTTWQKAVGVTKKRKDFKTPTLWKRYLGSIAKNLYPESEIWSKGLGVQDQLADAILIAHYCKEIS